jgi:hypothetical protein
MRTSMNIPEELLRDAKEAGRTKTKTQAVILALSEFIARRKARRVLELKGSMESSYDHRRSRGKR